MADPAFTLAIFASDRGPGDPERASIMSHAATLLARRGARIICLAEEDSIPVPLVTSARAAGAEVIVVADEDFHAPPALADLVVERIADDEAKLTRVAALADVLVGLPGSLLSATNLYRTWVRAGAKARKPVVLLNRNRAFEVIRGFSADVLTHSLKRPERHVVFTDNIEDLWNKVSFALHDAGHASLD